MLKIAPATASKELKGFAKKGILKENKERNLILYKSDTNNEFYKDLKTFYNIRRIKESGFINSLNIFYLKPPIILFGSFAEGLDMEESDIDLVIISEKKEDFPDLRVYEKKLNRKIQLFVLKNIKSLKNNYLINNILRGIVLQGEIKWIQMIVIRRDL